MFINKGKLTKEQERMKGLLEVVAIRTDQLSTSVSNYTKYAGLKEAEKNERYGETFRLFTSDLRKLIDHNSYLGQSFVELGKNVEKLNQISHFFDHVEEIEKMVN